MTRLSHQLLAQAERLATIDQGRPLQANLRRAISSAYYAVFHFLIEEAISLLVGSGAKNKDLGDFLARAFEHGEMKDAAMNFAQNSSSIERAMPQLKVSDTLRRCAKTFVELQGRRHLADYDRRFIAIRGAVMRDIDRSNEMMKDWKSIRHTKEASAFLLSMLVWRKTSRR